ncbi:MAG: hypothetical protein US63_C0026G0016 [Candidatus Moranbacteria bacterium GW2011_GWC2_37_8]|nr:MAG: hypothetical protein US63_C0026G0016 [Candidatus Moranbacteria bacterium GW2011_GWC2_37_8]KKQ62899.1 MAG: hypothetical protein US82_C0004G0016 [Parcubacteria group bacterium GW2011_GWC1_38_22]KKQ81471.1 MAG: hypothetical protein UT03_C0001G0011 [Candidatus Moranbacteria bacterium GW2011_GWD2_38_7]
MLVWKGEKLLLIERAKFPFAYAPPAGHCDGDDFEFTAKKELEEEVGLQTKSLKLLTEGRKENPCRRIDGTWHYWQIFEVEVAGEVKRSEEETKQYKWVTKNELNLLAKRTEDFTAGKISEEEWGKNPGLEIVWYEWMKELKII